MNGRPRNLAMRRAASAVLLVTALVASRTEPGIGAPLSEEIELLPVPEVALEHREEGVRRRLGEGRAHLEARARDGVDDGPERVAALGEAYGEMGRLYLAHGLDAAAEACLLNAERLAPETVDWSYHLGILYQEQRRLEPAASRFEHVLALRPGDPATLLRLGEVRLLEHRLAEARKLFHRAIESDSTLAAAHYGLGRIASLAGDPSGAADHFETVLSLQPQATRVHYPLAQAYRQLGQSALADRHLAKRGNVGVHFPDPLNEGLSRLVESAGSHLYRAGRAMSRGDFETALAEYGRVLELEPGHAVARRALGITLFRLGRLADAIAAFKSGLEAEPESALLHYNLGTALAAQGSPAAVEHLRRAVTLAPDLGDAHFNLALALGGSGRFDEALAELDAVLAVNPNDLGARLLRSQALEAAGNHAAAIAELRRIVDIEPRHLEARLKLGRLLLRLGETEQAESEWKSMLALELEPAERAQALFALGNLLAEEGWLNRAFSSYREAIALDPDSLPPRLALAAALMRIGRYQEALTEYGRILGISPRHESAELGRAATLVLAGNPGEGRTALEQAQRADPESLAIAHALARLLATSNRSEVRDGERALALARELFAQRPTLEHAETVAMAYAELGRFDEAVAWQRRLLAQVEEQRGNTNIAAGLRSRLELYERGEAYRSP